MPHKLVPFLLLCYLLFCQVCLAQSINQDSLHKEISTLNDNNQNDKSILILDKIINSGKSTAYEKYIAYIEKSLTYKQLYNYSSALTNLDLAWVEGQKTKHIDEVETRIVVEKIMIHYDLKNEREFIALIKQVKPQHLHYLKKETRAFYECILGHLELKKENFQEADAYFDTCIRFLEQENPKHLPILYKAKIELYQRMGLKDAVMDAYAKGIAYASQYGIDLYKITMYETMIYYYVEQKDYENAFKFQKTVSEARRQYDAANRSGKLNMLENDLLQQRSETQMANRQKIMILLCCIIFLLILLSFVLYKLYRSTQKGRKLMEVENQFMRSKLEDFINRSPNFNSNLPGNLNKQNLTTRHLEIIELVKQGKTNKEIGALLFISENTVKYHLKTIYELLEIDNRSALADVK